jgi:hypothetical protein
MATANATDNLSELGKSILGDVEKLIGQQFSLIRRELVDELEKALSAGLSIGGGAGATAVGGTLGVLAVVHLVHQVAGLPLWLCYALVGGALAATGAGLVSAGIGEASRINLLPGMTSHEHNGRRQHAAASA